LQNKSNLFGLRFVNNQLLC